MNRLCVTVFAVVTMASATSVFAQAPPATTDVSALARETQNPVGSVTTLPFQFNFNTGGDLNDRTLFNINFQPVIPFKASSNWTFISRTIVPMQSIPGSDGFRYSGLGDIQAQLFITPAKPGAIIWGVGPMFSLPTATVTGAETGTWAGGPAIVVVKMTGPVVMGALATWLFPMSDAGGDPKTDLFTLQPFFNVNFGQGWAVSVSPLVTDNLDAIEGNQWTVPMGMGLTRTTIFNRRPMNIGFSYFHNVVRPAGAAGQQVRFSVTLLYPR